MNKTSTMYIMCHTVCQPCTTPMYINHVHQYHTIYHKISSMECINHMPRTCANCVPTICLYQHANHVPQTSVISLMICLYHEPSATTMYLNHQYINQASQLYHPIHHVPKQVYNHENLQQTMSDPAKQSYTIKPCCNSYVHSSS
jgi:hypothetical protein